MVLQQFSIFHALITAYPVLLYCNDCFRMHRRSQSSSCSSLSPWNRPLVCMSYKWLLRWAFYNLVSTSLWGSFHPTEKTTGTFSISNTFSSQPADCSMVTAAENPYTIIQSDCLHPFGLHWGFIEL